MKNRYFLMFGFILLVLIGSIQFLTVFAGDPVPGVDISLEQIPGGIKVDLGGYQTEYGIVIGTGTTGSDVDYAIVLDIIPLSNFQQNVQDELVVSSENIRKNTSTVTKQADSPYEFYAASPGHKSVEELTMYRVSINSADLSNEELKSYIIKRIEQQEQVRGGYIGGKGGEGAARVSENNTIQLVGVCNGCTIGELLQMVENHNSSRSNKSYLVINCDGCNINEGTYGVVGEQAIEVIKATTKAKKESSNEDAAAQREGYIGGKGGEGKIESGDMTQPRPKVPGWIKNNAEWFAQGVISEDDFVKGLEWMINNGIIRAEHAAGGVK